MRFGDLKPISKVPLKKATALPLSTSVKAHRATILRRSFGGLEPCALRAGVLVVPTVLLYGTGGLAYGNVQVTDTVFSSNFGTASFSSSDTRVGWTVGFGIEGLFFNAPQWTWRVEYLYLDLGSVNGSGIDPVANLLSGTQESPTISFEAPSTLDLARNKIEQQKPRATSRGFSLAAGPVMYRAAMSTLQNVLSSYCATEPPSIVTFVPVTKDA